VIPLKATTALAPARGAAHAWWASLAPRERRLVAWGAALLGLLLLWLLAVQPAIGTLRSAPAEHDRLDSQLQGMQRLAAEVAGLRATPPVSADQATAALKAATDRLGEQARLTLQGDRAVLTLNGVGSGPLRDWLAEARSGARARPVEATLSRGASGFSGTVVLSFGNSP
jgi:general secretion pathway protein M